MKKSVWFTAFPLCLSALVALWWLIDIPELFSGHFSTYYHIDLDVYREGGAGFGSDLYAKDYLVGSNRDVSLPFTYPPFAALLFVPLSWIPLTAASILISIASFAALWGCVALVLRALRCPGWAGWALLAAMLTEPITETFSFGQVNILLTALVVVDILWLSPSRGRGVLTGITMAIKLTPAVFLAVFFVRREWRAFFSALGAFLAAGLLAFACNPHSSIQYWSDTLRDSNRIGGLAYSSNQSLRGFFSRLAPEHAEKLWLVAVLLVIALVWFTMERLSQENQAVLMLLAASVSLLCSPVSWSHHFTWLVLAGVLLVARRHWGFAALTWLALLARGHWLVPHANDQELSWAWWQHIVGNDYAIVTALLVLCSLPLALRRAGAYQSAVEPASTQG
ncbi:glycosyltransferase 87 family protein [Corynebacterium kefirresidentii]|uniref:glycosyltransferase 87 family protein n=1 Tax=Corynebacterium sp. MSK185 TaxID=3377092 RepID=UPI00254D13BF|nr:glycosyltransferase 87 family protein [Corynebacterium kefirresidentii]MDK8586343.1 glycosyltransferase 87 family protein [Corynebacterium kefirresidentii]